ncbi:MAG: TonB-dependent receptor [Bacteroidales bacterium]|jgi:hypothetical protein|nr:TonB-dependent receptor [Bacteroidales bacterium]
MKKIVYLIIISLSSLNTFAQTVQIKGKVSDVQTEEALPGANVFLQSDWSIGSTTDVAGDFILNINKSFGKDTLIISFIGYKDRYIPISDKTTSSITIKLEPFAELIRETVITARRIIAEEFTVKQIKQLDIYLNPAAKADPLLAINAMPASTTTDESANISLRGSRPDETGIYLNDVPIYDAIRFSQINGIGTFSIFNTEIIERMHVFPGNPPLEYGNTASGLVSLQTRNQIPLGPSNSLSISLANLGASTSRKISDKTALVVFGNYQPSKIFTGLNQEAMHDLEDFSSFDLGFHILHNFNSKLRIKLFNYSNMEAYEFNTRVPSYTGIFDMNKKRNYTIANFILQQEKREFTVNTGFNISSENYNYSITDIDINKQDIYLSATYQHFFDKWSIKTGGSFDYRINDSKGYKPLYNHAQNLNHPTIYFDSSQEYYLPELFVYSKFNITDNLILGTGIRKNVVLNHTSNYFSYQGNLNYKISSKHNFNLSAGHYNRLSMPNAEQYEITHFESNQYSVDYTYTGNRIEVQTSVFSKNVDYANFNNEILGGEIYTKVNLKPFEFQFSLTTIDSEIKTNTEAYPSNYDLDYFIRSVLKYNLKDIIEISTIYIFRQGAHNLPVIGSTFDNETATYYPSYSTWSYSERLPDYHKIDLSVSKYWVVNPKLIMVLYANVSNILNYENVMGINYNTDYTRSFNELYSQRTIYFGVSFIF